MEQAVDGLAARAAEAGASGSVDRETAVKAGPARERGRGLGCGDHRRLSCATAVPRNFSGRLRGLPADLLDDVVHEPVYGGLGESMTDRAVEDASNGAQRRLVDPFELDPRLGDRKSVV